MSRTSPISTLTPNQMEILKYMAHVAVRMQGGDYVVTHDGDELIRSRHRQQLRISVTRHYLKTTPRLSRNGRRLKQWRMSNVPNFVLADLFSLLDRACDEANP